jgi:hypothetical protein
MDESPSARRELSPKADRSLFADLLATSHAIKRVLSPVDLRPSFVSKLREELNGNVENARAAFVHRQRRRDKIKWTAIGAGLAVYSVGVSVVIVWLIRWGLSRMRKSAPSPRS